MISMSTLSNDELDKFISKIPELKRVSFQCLNEVFKQKDKNHPFVIPNWLLIIIRVLGTIVLLIIASMIWYFRYCKAIGKVRHFLKQLRGIIFVHQLLTSCTH